MSEKFPGEHWCKTALDEVRAILLQVLPRQTDLTTVELAQLAADKIRVGDFYENDEKFADVQAAFDRGVKLSTAKRLPPELEEALDRMRSDPGFVGFRRERPQRKTEE
jgi:hypothetical protein